MRYRQLGDPGLTTPDPQFSKQVDGSIPGMAHFAGTGPDGAVCGRCGYWIFVNIGHGTSPRCSKYAEMMGGKFGPAKIPHNTPACRYFKANAHATTARR